MQIRGNTILITGGATGIGFAMAEKFVNLGNTVIICGRRQEMLDDAKKKLPQIHTIKCDISNDEDRTKMFEWITAKFSAFNMLINNAGIQRKIDLKAGIAGLGNGADEIDINLKSQILLSELFMPLLLKRESAAIVNVSSGLGIVPISIFPLYCATKAALHSFTMSLRHQLRDTRLKVFEVIPPSVHDTLLKGKQIPKSEFSISSAEMADAVVKGMEKDVYEITAGASTKWLANSKEFVRKIFDSINH